MAEALTIELPQLNLQTMRITLVGDAPLICHAWSTKAKRAMLDKQMKKGRAKKEAKNPEKDYEESLYLHDGLYGFPAVAFKSAAVGACRFVENIKMTFARGAFHVVGEMIAIEGEPSPREDMVRVGMGVADIRYRGEFKEWRCTLLVQFNANAISPEQLVNLFNTAGFAIGIGEWRPEKNGSYGRFHVATEEPQT
jgi:hypothetical protein